MIGGVAGITSLIFGLVFATFSLFFLLKDGPALRAWLNTHLGVPPPLAQTVTGEVVSSIRRYFLGVTIVATFNALVVLLQNVVQPVAFGATLSLNPLLILVVTIGAGALLGMAGMVLAAPLTSAAVHIGRQRNRARAAPA